MMDVDEQIIIRFALVFSIIGLIIIYVVSAFFGPEAQSIKNISEKDVGLAILVFGTVKSSRLSGNTFFLKVEEKDIVIVAFNYDGRVFKKGDLLRIEGRVEKYKGKLEIIASSFAIVDEA